MSISRKIKVVVNNNVYLVEVNDLSASPLTVKVNGRQFQVAVEAVDEVAPLPVASPSPVPAAEVNSAPTQPLVSQPGTVTAPMPGNIVEIYVKTGDAITRDQLLCSLEAMKMQNAIRSSCAGVISTVAVQPGQTVGYGELLFTLE